MTTTQNPTPVATATTAPSASTVRPPSIHVRALLTWIAIFPLVTLGLTAIAPFAETWPPALRAFALTIVVVPLAVYLVVPQLLKVHGGLARRFASRRA
ncbi:hypothetical protein SAMN05428970_2914 [Agromyces sp. CF514]|uniref:hypothetical protein n=1 Tax=Agromyces sp. CF514 TaxID=1881031 RepID=UPI0008EA1407|nr:hypothetical protein [Agromyces sp. CF514]SFR84044.1 hypothetical protein SAMN05428970_2914 [Agromyces sp. CF514]